MSRLVWMGIGAAGGIYTYRRGQQAWGRAKERGVAGTATVMTAAASTMLSQLRAQQAQQSAVPQSGSSQRRRAATLV